MAHPLNVTEADTIFEGPWGNVPVCGIIPELETVDARQIGCYHLGGRLDFFVVGKKAENIVAAAALRLARSQWHDPITMFRTGCLLEEACEINNESAPLLLNLGYGTWQQSVSQESLEKRVSPYMDVERYRAIMLSVPDNLETMLQKLRVAGIPYSLDGMIDEVEANRIAVTDVLRTFGVDRKDVVAERHGRLSEYARTFSTAFQRLIPNVQPDDEAKLTTLVVDLLLKGFTEGHELVAGAWMRLRYNRQQGGSPLLIQSGDSIFIMSGGPAANPDDILESVAMRVSKIFDGVNPHELAVTLRHIREDMHLMPIVAK